MTDKINTALSTFSEGFSCSQAVLSAFSEGLGLDNTTAFRVSGAFGGGMAATGMTCGAVTGALMVIGLAYGKYRADDHPAKEKTYELAQQFMKRFYERHGSIVCKDLLGHDISTTEGKLHMMEEGLLLTLCPRLVRSAAEIVEEIL